MARRHTPVRKSKEDAKALNEALKNENEKGNWDDLASIISKVEEVPIVYEKKVHLLKYTVCTWEVQNLITKAIMRELGPGASKWEYERLKQEKMIRAMVKEIDGVAMNEKAWCSLPFVFGELIRVTFFVDTAEYEDQLRKSGLAEESIKEILSEIKDGLLTQEEKELKN